MATRNDFFSQCRNRGLRADVAGALAVKINGNWKWGLETLSRKSSSDIHRLNKKYSASSGQLSKPASFEAQAQSFQDYFSGIREALEGASSTPRDLDTHRRSVRALRADNPAMHPYTLSLHYQRLTGHELTGRDVAYILGEL